MSRFITKPIRSLLSHCGINFVSHSIHGRRYLVPLECTSLKHLFFCRDNTYEAEVYHFIVDLARPGAVVFDIGAHLGKYIIGFFDRLQSGGQITAFEANPITANYLSNIVEMNQLMNVVQVLNTAVGDSVGQISLNLKGAGADPGQTLYDNDCHESHRIPMTTVDEHVHQTGVFPDLIKIDVEGYELKVLHGAKRTLSEGAPIICCEIHPQNLAHFGAKPVDVETWLQSFGYVALPDVCHQHGSESHRPYNLIFEKSPESGPEALSGSTRLHSCTT